MTKKTLIFNNINYSNFWFCFLLSKIWTVKTFQFGNYRIKKWLKHIPIVKWEDYLHWEELNKYVFEQTFVIWAKTIKFVDADNIFINRIDDVEINVSQKIQKDLGPIFERLHLFQTFRKENELLISGIDIYYIGKYTDYSLEDKTIVFKWIESINICLEHLGRQLFYSVRHIYFIGIGCKSMRKKGNITQLQKTKIIWCAVSGRSEMSSDRDNLNCLWILNNSDLEKEEILFILPRVGVEQISHDLKRLGINYICFPIELVRFFPSKLKIKMLIFLFKQIGVFIKGFVKISLRNEFNANKLSMVIWKNIIPSLDIKTYVNSVSHALCGSYDLVLLNRLSVNTVMYCYSANSEPVSIKEKLNSFHLSYSSFLHKSMVVWHNSYAQRIYNNYENKPILKISGPLVPGKEKYSKEELAAYREKVLKKSFRNPFIVSVFDVAPKITQSGGILITIINGVYSEKYCTDFIKDIDRLMEEIPELVILYKPKKNFSGGEIKLPDGIEKMLIKNNPRWINLDITNPYLPILVADLVISIPFTSTNIVALNKGKAFLYHNPNHYIKYHSYGELERYITHSYDALREKVIAIMNKKVQFDDLKKTGFYVQEPKGGFTQGFVEFLRNPEDEFTPTSEFTQ